MRTLQHFAPSPSLEFQSHLFLRPPYCKLVSSVQAVETISTFGILLIQPALFRKFFFLVNSLFLMIFSLIINTSLYTSETGTDVPSRFSCGWIDAINRGTRLSHPVRAIVTEQHLQRYLSIIAVTHPIMALSEEPEVHDINTLYNAIVSRRGKSSSS